MAGDAPNLSHQGFAASPKPTALDFQPPSNYRVSLKEGRELKQACLFAWKCHILYLTLSYYLEWGVFLYESLPHRILKMLLELVDILHLKKWHYLILCYRSVPETVFFDWTSFAKCLRTTSRLDISVIPRLYKLLIYLFSYWVDPGYLPNRHS